MVVPVLLWQCHRHMNIHTRRFECNGKTRDCLTFEYIGMASWQYPSVTAWRSHCKDDNFRSRDCCDTSRSSMADEITGIVVYTISLDQDDPKGLAEERNTLHVMKDSSNSVHDRRPRRHASLPVDAIPHFSVSKSSPLSILSCTQRPLSSTFPNMSTYSSSLDSIEGCALVYDGAPGSEYYNLGPSSTSIMWRKSW